jgi:hypothetical protein
MVNQASLVDRIMRAIKADPKLFDEVEHDESATQQAAIVVAIGAVSSAIGGAIAAVFLRGQVPAAAGAAAVPVPGPIGTLIVTLVLGFVTWIVWSYITYFVGTRMFGGTATPAEMLRCIGFANAPRILGIIQLIPFVGGLILFVLAIWSIYIGFVAVRQALDFDNQKAILTIIISGVISLIIQAVLGALLLPVMMLG